MIFTKQKIKEYFELNIKRMNLITKRYTIEELEAFIVNNELTYNDWSNISAYQILSEAFIDKHSDRVNWYNISYNQMLSEPIIEKYKDTLAWFYIMLFQKLSYEFMEKHLYRYNLYAVSIENNINKDNIIKLIDKYQHKYYIDELEETMNI